MKVIDEEMEAVGGVKMSMPKLLPKELWERTGRWNDMGSELIRLKDRKGEDFCLAPTHEEIVTSIVASGVSSKKHLPLRLYQIGDKYRDEARPRFGLLRGREFVMKDMYSFDSTQSDAMNTYDEVRGAYHNIMRRLELPYAVAEADSGNIGGNLSHEFHALTDIGEDTLLWCKETGYHANLEKAKSNTTAVIHPSHFSPLSPSADLRSVLSVLLKNKSSSSSSTSSSPSSSTSSSPSLSPSTCPINATVFTDPSSSNTVSLALTDASYEANEYLVKGHFKLGANFASEPLNSSSLERFLAAEEKRIVIDLAFASQDMDDFTRAGITQMVDAFKRNGVTHIDFNHVKVAKVGDKALGDLGEVSSKTGENIGTLEERKGIEVGHLFYLGTKYSAPLKANITGTTAPEAIEMGCYGIGVSRLLAVAVETSNDENGIIWPQAIAPYLAMVIPTKKESETGRQVYDILNGLPGLSGEVMLDDRLADSVGYRVKESEFIGIPYAVVLGSKFKENGLVEIIDRKSRQSHHVSLQDLPSFFQSKLSL